MLVTIDKSKSCTTSQTLITHSLNFCAADGRKWIRHHRLCSDLTSTGRRTTKSSKRRDAPTPAGRDQEYPSRVENPYAGATGVGSQLSTGIEPEPLRVLVADA